MKKIKRPRPAKPPNKQQNPRTQKPPGKNEWVRAYWRYDYVHKQWEWVKGHWRK